MNFFTGVKTIESVMGTFQKSVEDLHQIAQEHKDLAISKLDRAVALREEADGYAAESQVAIQEGDRATAAAAKLEIFYDSIVNPQPVSVPLKEPKLHAVK